MSNELSQQYKQALELHNKILVSAQLAQNNLLDMCTALKEMRDGKLYKELGYQNFEDYCGAEFNMSRANASKYISILENIKDVSPVKHLGVSKLYLLSTLSESEQQEIIDNNDMDSITRKELEAQVRKLKEENEELEKAVDKLGKKTGSQISPLVKEWADMVLFANYKTVAVQASSRRRAVSALCTQSIIRAGTRRTVTAWRRYCRSITRRSRIFFPPFSLLYSSPPRLPLRLFSLRP